MSRRVGGAHVIWAYQHIVEAWAREGLSAGKIRDRLREEHSLHVGTDAVKTVMPRRAHDDTAGTPDHNRRV